MLVLGGLPNVLAPQQKPFWQAEELTAQRRPVTLPAFNHYTDSLAHGGPDQLGLDGAPETAIQWEGVGTSAL
ncbi:hypothetical protein ACKKBF_B34080 [Auxenochlorella protothecoides x Auxenochlorella symbiontica]